MTEKPDEERDIVLTMIVAGELTAVLKKDGISIERPCQFYPRDLKALLSLWYLFYKPERANKTDITWVEEKETPNGS